MELPSGTGGRTPTVDVWSARVPYEVETAASALSSEELGRLRRRIGEASRRRALSAWTVQREVLASYLGCESRDVPLERDPDGRPLLRTEGLALSHSMAHSGDWVMLAVSRSTPLGIDLERVEPAVDALRLAARFFAPDEADALAALPEARRAAAFFRAWTEKEAYLKGIGGGVPSRLRSVRVTVDPRTGGRGVGAWSLHPVEAPTGYVATLAVRAPAVRIRATDRRP